MSDGAQFWKKMEKKESVWSIEQQAVSGGEQECVREGNDKAGVLLYLKLEEEGHMVLVLKAFHILCKVGNTHV